jgi:Fe-S cluster biogenesis protein NfuA
VTGRDLGGAAVPTPDFETRVRAVLDTLRPMLRADGGDVELVAVDEARGRIELRLTGACTHCLSSVQTMSLGIEASLKRELPGVRQVVRVC